MASRLGRCRATSAAQVHQLQLGPRRGSPCSGQEVLFISRPDHAQFGWAELSPVPAGHFLRTEVLWAEAACFEADRGRQRSLRPPDRLDRASAFSPSAKTTKTGASATTPGHLRQPGCFLHRGMHTPRLFRGILCLWHSPVLGRPLARTGRQTIDPALRDKTKTAGRHGDSTMM